MITAPIMADRPCVRISLQLTPVLSCWHRDAQCPKINAMSSEGPCPGGCNARYREARDAYRQALADYDPLDAAQSRPDPPSLQPWLGDPWCPRCKSRIRENLAELDDLGALLLATGDGHRGTSGGERVSGSAVPVSPSPAHDDLEELASMLSGWEDAYRGIKGWPSLARRGFLASAVTTCIAWLSSHLDGILTSDIGRDFGAEILQWHREFTGKSKAGVRTLKKPMRCPGCQLLTLTWTEGDKHVACGNPDCSRILTLAEYEAETERLAKGHDAA